MLHLSCPPNPNFIEATKRFLMATPIAQHRVRRHRRGAGPLGDFSAVSPRALIFVMGLFQAGSIGALADMAAACSGVTMLPNGWAASMIDYTVKLLALTVGEKLVARGRREIGSDVVVAADVFVVRDGRETLRAIALTTIGNLETPQPS